MNCPAPVEISYENMHFLITHNPTNKYGVMTLVRVCDATYDKAPVEKEGIHPLLCCTGCSRCCLSSSHSCPALPSGTLAHEAF
uniref:Uncharacterized protein n=1 Tax=Colobus angolensis palliatus TaxID=336983 RepID=A0A2K5HTA8_COLAP